MTTRRFPLVLLLAAPVLAALAVLSGAGPVRAEGGPPSAPPAAPADQSLALGSKLFDDAIQYVSRGRGGIPSIRDFYVKLDGRLDLDAGTQEGQIRLWYQTPNLYRFEVTFNNATTTKILAGDAAGWSRTPDGRVQNLMMNPEGRRMMDQLKADRDRLSDLSQFLTLQTLKGPGVAFRFDSFRTGSAAYAGEWAKVVRSLPGKADVTFWLAYVRDAQTGAVQATWPGVIRVQGDPAKGIPTEDYILKEWDSPMSQQNRDFRYPRVIEGYSLLVGPDGRERPQRFLYAVVDDIKINAGIDASRFADPSRAPPPR